MWLWFDKNVKRLSKKTNVIDYYLKPPTGRGLLDFEPLNMKDLSGAFYLLAVGLTISFVVFLIEILVHRINNGKWLRRGSNIPIPSTNLREPILIFPELLKELPQRKKMAFFAAEHKFIKIHS